MPSYPVIAPGDCGAVTAEFYQQSPGYDNPAPGYYRWSVYHLLSGGGLDLLAQGDFPGPADTGEWTVTGTALGTADEAGILATVCVPESVTESETPDNNTYAVILRLAVQPESTVIYRDFRGDFIVSRRPPAPTIAAVGFLNGNVPQINVSGN